MLATRGYQKVCNCVNFNSQAGSDPLSPHAGAHSPMRAIPYRTAWRTRRIAARRL